MSSYMLLVFLLLALSQGITDRVIISLIDFMHWFQWFDWFADVKVKDLIRWWLFWWGGRQHCWLQFGWVLDRLSSRLVACFLIGLVVAIVPTRSLVRFQMFWLVSNESNPGQFKADGNVVFARRPILRLVWLLPVCSARRSSNLARWGWQQMKVTKQEETSWKPPMAKYQTDW